MQQGNKLELTYITSLCSGDDQEHGGTTATRKKSQVRKQLELDNDGFLMHADEWDETVAIALAKREGIKLTDAHWEVLHIIRDFYHRRGLSPIMRIMVKLLELTCGPEKGNALYLRSLFDDNAAIAANRIAGLPRPTNCI